MEKFLPISGENMTNNSYKYNFGENITRGKKTFRTSLNINFVRNNCFVGVQQFFPNEIIKTIAEKESRSNNS